MENALRLYKKGSQLLMLTALSVLYMGGKNSGWELASDAEQKAFEDSQKAQADATETGPENFPVPDHIRGAALTQPATTITENPNIPNEDWRFNDGPIFGGANQTEGVTDKSLAPASVTDPAPADSNFNSLKEPIVVDGETQAPEGTITPESREQQSAEFTQAAQEISGVDGPKTASVEEVQKSKKGRVTENAPAKTTTDDGKATA